VIWICFEFRVSYFGFRIFQNFFQSVNGSPLKEEKKDKLSSQRPSWEEYFMDITHLVAKRSTCLRRQVGAVLVKDKKILATGYNGAPSRLEHCFETGCLREKRGIPSGERHELCRGLHAEQNAIIKPLIMSGDPGSDPLLYKPSVHYLFKNESSMLEFEKWS